MFRMNYGLNDSDSQENHFAKNLATFYNIISITQNYIAGLSKYANEFMIPYLISTNYFNEVERNKLLGTSILESLTSYMELWNFSLEIFSKGATAGVKAMNDYGLTIKQQKFAEAYVGTNNASQSLIDAGYAPVVRTDTGELDKSKTAKRAQQYLSNPKIRAYVETIREEVIEKIL